MADQFKARTLKRKNVKGLALNAAPKPTSTPSNGDAQAPGAAGNGEATRTDTLEIGLEFRLDLRSEDLVTLKELGAGNGGTVSKVMHASTKVVMARKIIRVDAKENVRKQILRELQVGHDCNSPNIVTFYGAFQNEARDIVLCMEYMDCGSLDRISKDFGPIRVDVLGKITESILAGLVYLYEAHRIMHRDIKPSNVLVNSRGNIKLCDFGVATETVNSIADTFVGTSTYMAPERIQGGAYTVRSDVWSVGLTVMELAVGRFPFDASDSAAGDRASAGPMGILDLLQQIVHEPAPKLPRSDAFPPVLHEFVAKCLLKKSEERPTPLELYEKDAFLQAAKRTPVDLQEWAISMMERHNRKSYLAPPAPKSLKESRETSSPVQAPSPVQKHVPSRPSRGATGEIPLNVARDIPPQHRQHTPSNQSHYSSNQSHYASNQSQYPSNQSHYPPNPSPYPSRSNRSSPPISLEHLSLESKQDEHRPTRRPSRTPLGDTSSSLDQSLRPSIGSRSASSHNTNSRMPLQSTALPFRAAPTPGGVPAPNSASWQRRGDYMGAV
ncbi:MAP kinase kinase Ste7 [Aspergillus mulundensis]|uniref:MAP kinase kinase n=1 Tax=Aspergillus mulundensis TaxID=1810919 RepID=A0A3D8SLE5_9EURO|nr:MAP kinase kinase [Aspergillus mulundensis]RDW87159.1 MAP kinase kinase [Aspergillus mulundensis]